MRLACAGAVDVTGQRELVPSLFQRGVFLALCLFSGLLPESVSASTPSQILGPDLPYRFIAEGGEPLSFQESRERLQEVGQHQRDIFSAGYTDEVYWLNFHIPQQAFLTGEQWLQVAPSYLDHVRLYYREVGSNKAWQRGEFGDLSPMPRGDLDYRFGVLRLKQPEAGKGYEFIVRLQSTSATLLYATLWEPREFVEASTAADSFWGFYFGLAVLCTVFSVCLAMVFGDRLLWSICSFSISYLLVACVQGYIDWLIPSGGFFLQHYLTSVSVLLSYPALIWLAAESLRLRELLPPVYRLVTKTALVLTLFVVSIPLGLFGQAVTIQGGVYICIALTLCVSAAYVLWVERFRVSTVILAASPLFLMAVSAIALGSVFGLINFDADLYLVWQYMLVINMLLAMGISIARIIRRRREQAESEQLALELEIEREARFNQRQFMGMVSHEFRTPLAVISASLENLICLENEENEENDSRLSRYDKIRKATDRLVHLTDNCLADARLAANNLYLDPKPADLIDVVHSAAALVHLSSAHQLKLTVDGQPIESNKERGWTEMVDSALVRIALSNIIDNAVKYSPEGCVHVDCSRREGKPTILVSDEGSGVSREDATLIFERYRRGSHSKRGAGLGLYIARHIARTHGGDLRLVGTGAQGSCFELTFSPRGGGGLDQ